MTSSPTTLGTALTPNATKVMMCGCGELGKEVVIELQRRRFRVSSLKSEPSNKRRLGVVVARGETLEEAREKAMRAAGACGVWIADTETKRGAFGWLMSQRYWESLAVQLIR